MMIKLARLAAVLILSIAGIVLPAGQALAILPEDQHCALDGYACTYYLQDSCDSTDTPDPTATGSSASASCCNSSSLSTQQFGPGNLPSYIKQPYNGIFTAAGQKYNVDPAVLVGIFYDEQYGYQNAVSAFNQHEMPNPPPPYGSGPAWATSPTGAQGPFQFEPATWAEDGVDGNGDGIKDPNDLTDAAFGAANKLGRDGATIPETQSKIENAATAYSGGYPQYSQNVWTIFQKIKQDEGGSAVTTPATSEVPAPSGSTCGTTTTGANIYQDPFHNQSGVGASRVDSGADLYAISAPVPVYAIGDGKIDIATAHGTFYPPNPGWISYTLTDPAGAAYNKVVYVSEGCPPQPDIIPSPTDPHPAVTSNTLLCYMQPSSIEMGWAMNDTEQLAMAYGTYVESYATIYGQNFTEMLYSLGLTVKECYDHPGSTYRFNPPPPAPPVPASLPPAWIPNPDITKEGPNAC